MISSGEVDDLYNVLFTIPEEKATSYEVLQMLDLVTSLESGLTPVKLYVANFDRNVTKERLLRFFEFDSPVIKMDFIRNEIKQYAFLTVCRRDLHAHLGKHDQFFDRRRLVVRMAK